ncbi:alpha/beta hydrolase family protein [Arenibacterium sp. CAU 1754]
MARLNLLEAARMVEENYAGTNADDIETTIDVSGVQATYLKNGVLVIPGTNELSDWFDFNLNFAPVSPLDAHGFEVVPGDSGTLWHGGFLKHAQMVYMFAKAVQPRFIVGHSLGAASAQIVGMSLAIPTIGFASPQTCRSRERLPNEGWVVNFCRIDDHVCHMPPKFLGFRTIGSRYWLKPDAPDPDEDHKIHNYAELLRLAHISDVLPMHWPA